VNASGTIPTLDSVLLEFDRQWPTHQGRDLAGFVERLAPGDRPEALRELVKIDLQNRWSRGERRALEEYLAEHPGLATTPELRTELLEEELIARRRGGESLDEAELRRRFPEEADLVRTLWDSVCRQHRPRSLPLPGQPRAVSRLPGTDTVIGGRYRLMDRVGEGAHAEVFRATDPVLSREVAIKISRWPIVEGSDAAKRFLREAESIAQLQHPGIVSVYEFGRQDDRLFIVEELLTDGTLDERLRHGPVEPAKAVGWMREICNAVDYAHQCGVIHRDLKPANVLVDRHGRLRVGDFGLAAKREGNLRLTHDGDMLGTPAYMAPEQVEAAGNIQPATDVYALGAILYQMLTGSLPFSGPTASVLHQIVDGQVLSPRRRNPRIPAELETVCLKAMAREPGQRYAGAGDLAEDLRRFLDHEPLRARRTGWVGLLRLWVRRQPIAAAVLAISTTLLTTILAISFWRVTTERNRFRSERDRANDALFLSLTSNVKNELRVKSGGWHERAVEAVQTAAKSPAAGAHRGELRELAAEVLLDPAPRLQSVRRFPGPPEPAGGSAIAEQASGALSRSRAVRAVDLSEDGQWVLAGNNSGQVYLQPLAGGEPLILQTFDEPVLAVTLDQPGGQAFALAGSGLWRWKFSLADDLPKQDEIAPAKEYLQEIVAFALNPDCTRLVCGDEAGQLVLYRLKSGRMGEERRWQAHDGEVFEIAFSSDGLLCATSGADRFTRVWETGSGTPLLSYLSSDPARSISFGAGDTSLVYTVYEAFSLYALPLAGGVRAFGTWSAAFRGVCEIAPEEHLTISTDGQISLWKGQRVVASTGGFNEPVCFDVSRADRQFVVGNAAGELGVWKIAETGLSRRYRTRHAIDLDRNGVPSDEYALLDPDAPVTRNRSLRTNLTNSLVAGKNEDFVVTSNHDGQLMFYAEGKPRFINHGHKGTTLCLAVGNSDEWIVSCDNEGPARVWDRATLTLDHELPVALGRIFCVACDPEGPGIAVTGRSGSELIAADGTRTVLNSHVQMSGVVAFGKNSLAVSQSDGSVIVFAADGQSRLAEIASQKHGLLDVVFSSDGDRLFCLYANQDLACWDWRAGRLMQKTALDTPCGRLTADPLDRYLLALSGGNRCLVYDSKTLQRVAQIAHLRAHAGFSPDGSLIRHGGCGLLEFPLADLEPEATGEGAGGSERVVDASYEQIVPGGHLDTVWSVDLSPDDRLTATGAFDRMVKIWDNATGELRHNLTGHDQMVWRVRFSPDGELLASGSENSEEKRGVIRLWHPEAGESLGELTLGTRLIGGLDFHPGRPWLAGSSFDGTIGIVNTESRDWIATTRPFRQAVLDIEFSRDGQYLAAASLGNGVALWELGADPLAGSSLLEEYELLTEPNERVWAVAFSADGRWLAAGCESGTVLFYELATRKRVLALRTGCPRLRYLRFEPDGGQLWAAAFAGEGLSINLAQLQAELAPLNLAW
jgi:WD40 repeat protein/tRNA A-37 threonylcarbamoyl transferase component Bud32